MWSLLLLFPGVARADIAPEDPNRETCVPELQCGRGEEAARCGATNDDRADCDRLAREGWEPRCKTRGETVWSEVYCRPTGAPSRSAWCGVAAGPVATWIVGVAAALGAVRARRSAT